MKLEFDKDEMETLKAWADYKHDTAIVRIGKKVLAFLESQEQATPERRRMQSNPRADNTDLEYRDMFQDVFAAFCANPAMTGSIDAYTLAAEAVRYSDAGMKALAKREEKE